MAALHRKLLRDLLQMKAQLLAIALVIGSGVMTLIISVTSMDALRLSMQNFYGSHHLADVQVALARAPVSLIERLQHVPGVNRLHDRVVAPIRLEVPGFADPVQGQLISIPDGRQPPLNRLYLRSGTLPESGRNDQVVVSEAFALAHVLRPGDRLRLIIRGRYQETTISGIALSPEFVYQVGPHDLLPDDRRFGVFWMNRDAVARAFAMDGAFNSLLVSRQSGAEEAELIAGLDDILARYGGMGAHGREELISHRMLSQEIDELEVTAIILPGLFLSVSGFLLGVLIERVVRHQRQQIAVLRAFGYRRGELALHFSLMAGVVVLLGWAIGVVAGAWAAEALARLYAEYFRFPTTLTRLQFWPMVLALLVAVVAAALGTVRALSAAVRLAPAEAMRPPAPAIFHRSWIDRSRAGRSLGQSSRMILRHLGRHPAKSAMTLLGISLAAALLVLGSFQFGAVTEMIDQQYRKVLRMDIDLSFVEPTSAQVLAELEAIPGVRHAEGYRQVPVRLRHGHLQERNALIGLPSGGVLRQLIDADGQPIERPRHGLSMTRHLAEQLRIEPGERVEVQIMEGRRQRLELPLIAVVDEPLGTSAYLDLEELNTLMREAPALSGAWLSIEPSARDEVLAELRGAGRVAGIGLIRDTERELRAYMDDTMLVMMGIMLLLAGTITFALVYNNARIAFTERERELATLRVLGYSRAQVGWVLIGEMLLLTVLAIPVGWAIGVGFSWLLSHAISMDLFRIPFVISHQTLAFAAAGVLAATALSTVFILRRIRRLDMVLALKGVE
ncbi:ABC transporter permease [Wenzhouxiangella marina]|uniref:ABC transporter permease n=1 Tax=Wenzhouxiangella marina TaxID=1579979 RepID=UPI00067329C8|nr:ABC transporter permease [Wenzhouxiangella marina]